MPPRAPRGKGPAIATRRTPGGVVALLAGALVLGFAVLVLLAVGGVAESMGPLWGGFGGLLGAGVVILYRHHGYAAGADWFRRGDYWVDTTALRAATVSGDKLRLRGMQRGRKATVPLHVLREEPALCAPLARALAAGHAHGTLHTDAPAREFFALAPR